MNVYLIGLGIGMAVWAAGTFFTFFESEYMDEDEERLAYKLVGGGFFAALLWPLTAALLALALVGAVPAFVCYALYKGFGPRKES